MDTVRFFVRFAIAGAVIMAILIAQGWDKSDTQRLRISLMSRA